MRVRNIHNLACTLALLASHIETQAQQPVDLDSLIHNLNREVARLERYEKAQGELLANARPKFARWEELYRQMERSQMYSSPRSSLLTQASELEANINYLKPSLEDFDGKIQQTQTHLRPQLKALYERLPGRTISKATLEKMSFSTQQLLNGMRAFERGGVKKFEEIFDSTRAVRFAERAKYPDQIDSSPRSFTFDNKGKPARTRLVRGETYELLTKAGDSFLGEFMGFENDRMIFRTASTSWEYAELKPETVALKTQEIASVFGRMHDLGETEPEARGSLRQLPNRSSFKTDRELKEAIVRRGGIRGIYTPETTTSRTIEPNLESGALRENFSPDPAGRAW